MVLLSKIYTRGGDQGKTSLGNSTRVEKDSLRIHVIGEIDELNACLGLIEGAQEDVITIIRTLQNDLFDFGADLCCPEPKKNTKKEPLRIHDPYVTRLEEWIDHYNATLNPLKSFVLPGGSRASASLHMARTIARRAERSLWTLSKSESVNPGLMRYINRLSDLLFVLARAENNNGKDDILWKIGGVT